MKPATICMLALAAFAIIAAAFHLPSPSLALAGFFIYAALGVETTARYFEGKNP